MNGSSLPQPAFDLLRATAISRRLAKIALIALLVVNFCLLSYFVLSGYQIYFHSDSAVKNLLAQEMYETGRFFPSDWYYVNGDLWVVFGQLFIVPMLPFFENGYALHAVSGLCSAVLIMLGTWLVSGIVTPVKWLRLLMLAVLSSGISYLVSENLYGQVSYGSIYYLACFTLYFAWRSLQAKRWRMVVWSAALFVITTLTFWANPQRALASYTLPLLAALAIHGFSVLKDPDSRSREGVFRVCILLSVLVAGCLLGGVLHEAVLAGVNNVEGASSARWLSFNGMVRNFWFTLQGMLSIFGGLPTLDRAIMSKIGLYEGMRLITALTLICLIPVVAVRSLRQRNSGLRFAGAFTLISLGVFGFMQMTTTTPDMSDPITSARYLVPSLLLGLLLVAAAGLDAAAAWWYRAAITIVVAVLATSAIAPSNPLSQPLLGRQTDNRSQLVGFLESNGLRYGYASYWNAGALSVISAQHVRVRQVRIEKGLPMPFRHLGSELWYRPSAWRGTTFLMLTAEESQQVDWKLLSTYTGPPKRVLRFEQFYIYEFPQNISGRLPGWNDYLGIPLHIPLSDTTPHTAGKFEWLNGTGAMVAEQGEVGYLHFGPYLGLRRGHYLATFHLGIEGSATSPYARVEVTADQSRRVLGIRQLTRPGEHRVRLQIDLQENVADLELRVFVSGNGKVTLSNIGFRPVAHAIR